MRGEVLDDMRSSMGRVARCSSERGALLAAARDRSLERARSPLGVRPTSSATCERMI